MLFILIIFVLEIIFADKKLEQIANDDRIRDRALGKIRSKLFRRRMITLLTAISLEDIRMQPGYFHELKHDRKGQWACNLDQPYRLIFEPIENPIPKNENGEYDWSKIKGIKIIEIINYHKEK